MEPVDALECEAGLCVAAGQGALIAIFRRPTTLAHVGRIERYLQQAGGPLASLIVLEAGALAAPPEPAARAALERMLHAHPPRAAAIVVEGHGVRTTAMRLLLSGFLRARRAPWPHRGFPDAGEAVRWLSRQDPGVPAEGLAQALSQARAALGSRA